MLSLSAAAIAKRSAANGTRQWHCISTVTTTTATSTSLTTDHKTQQQQQQRNFSTTNKYAPNPLDAFRDPVDRQTRSTEPVGRSWSVTELRRKSYQDLHKLWYVLYKERNMLLTEQQLSRRRQIMFPQPERMQKVQKSMGAIKQVLGERKREKVAAHLAAAATQSSQSMEQSMQKESQDPQQEIV